MSPRAARAPAGMPVLNSISAFGGAVAAWLAFVPNEIFRIIVVIDHVGVGEIPRGAVL